MARVSTLAPVSPRRAAVEVFAEVASDPVEALDTLLVARSRSLEMRTPSRATAGSSRARRLGLLQRPGLDRNRVERRIDVGLLRPNESDANEDEHAADQLQPTRRLTQQHPR